MPSDTCSALHHLFTKLHPEHPIAPAQAQQVVELLGLSYTEQFAWFALPTNWRTRGVRPGELAHAKHWELANAARLGDLRRFVPATSTELPRIQYLTAERIPVRRCLVRVEGRLRYHYFDGDRLLADVPVKEYVPCAPSLTASASPSASSEAVSASAGNPS